jgi:hypothetical protein
MMARIPVWIAALWWGSLGTIGFLVVPLLFVHLPQVAMAGGMAARLFTAQSWVSCVCTLLLLFFSRPNRPQAAAPLSQDTVLFIAGGMLLALLSEFAVAPRIVARENLRLWHGIGSTMFVVQWLCAGVTLWKLTSPRPAGS